MYSELGHSSSVFSLFSLSVPEPPPSSSSSAAPTTTSSLVSPNPLPTSVVCNANCTTCDSMGCCLQCSRGFNRDGCGCG